MASHKLTIIAKILAKEEKRELVQQELLNLIHTTMAEKGCIDYSLHQDNQNPNLFLFYENWESLDLWQKHMESAHVAACTLAIEDAIEEVVLNEMTHIG
ncbi:putative quinol monooxygenase [Flagellimonas sp. 2504JD1-5]